jgi:hypothetical protein
MITNHDHRTITKIIVSNHEIQIIRQIQEKTIREKNGIIKRI